jgi:hypothetical protein
LYCILFLSSNFFFLFFVTFRQLNVQIHSLHALLRRFGRSNSRQENCHFFRFFFFYLFFFFFFFSFSFYLLLWSGFTQNLNQSAANTLDASSHGHSHQGLQVPHVAGANGNRKSKIAKQHQNVPLTFLVVVIALLCFVCLVGIFFFPFFPFLKKKTKLGPEPPPRSSGHAPLRLSAQVQPAPQFQNVAQPGGAPSPLYTPQGGPGASLGPPPNLGPSAAPALATQYPPNKSGEELAKDKEEREEEEEESKPEPPSHPLSIQVTTDFGHIEALREAPLRALLTLRASEGFVMPKPHLDLVVLLNRPTSEDVLWNYKVVYFTFGCLLFFFFLHLFFAFFFFGIITKKQQHAIEYVMSQLGPLDRLAVIAFEVCFCSSLAENVFVCVFKIVSANQL